MFGARAYIYNMTTYNSSFYFTPIRKSTVLTVNEVAEQLRLSPDTVKKLLNQGRLKGIRTGTYGGKWRVSQSALEAFINGAPESGSVSGH